jgi:hypothetical protein
MGSMMSLFIVCGCASGETSSAEAEQEIMTICHGNNDCGALQFCSTPLGQCGGQGVCEGRGINLYCVDRYQPVCGCDGQTYRNECFARKAGAAIDREGECLSSVCAGSDCSEQ